MNTENLETVENEKIIRMIAKITLQEMGLKSTEDRISRMTKKLIEFEEQEQALADTD